MILTDAQVTEFQTLYEKRFGEKISREEAYEGGVRLIQLLKIIYRPITKEEYIKYSQ